MKRNEYLSVIIDGNLDYDAIKRVEDKYKFALPDVIKCIISFSVDSVFFDDGYRSLSLDEIMDADKDLHVNFLEKQIIPLFDCNDNDFIVYNFMESNWSKFNIIEDSVFKVRKTLNELF